MIIVIDIALYRSGVTYIQLYIDFYKGLYTMKQHLVMYLSLNMAISDVTRASDHNHSFTEQDFL